MDTWCTLRVTLSCSACAQLLVGEKEQTRKQAFSGMRHAFSVLVGNWIYQKCEHSQHALEVTAVQNCDLTDF